MISAPTSNWLDRLRSSRGFPTVDQLDLDRFLSSSSSGSAPTTESATHSESTHSQPPNPTREKAVQWGPSTGEFAGVLCDLFNMDGGESSRTFSKKTARKQPNPRFCGVSSDTELPSSSNDLRKEKSDNGGFVSSGDNSLNEKRENCNGDVRVDDMRVDDGEDEEEDDDVDLKTYSRSEVTVIDTSFDQWKSDKWIYRKNDEWKIKEKKSKCKSRVCGGKKRKLLVSNLGENDKLDDDHMKKMKKMKEDESLLQMQPNKGQLQHDKERGATLGKVSRKRFPCPRPPEKSKNQFPQVILLKSLPSSNTDAAIKLGKTFQKKRPKQMKIV